MTLDDEQRKLLAEAAQGRFSCVDLRYEGGSYVGALDALVEAGLLVAEDREPAYMVSYRVTPEGRHALTE